MSLARLREVLAGPGRHVSPFFMLGDPGPERCLSLCRAALDAGASMLELGLPFSDPVADGPAVQAAAQRALAAGTTVDQCLALLQRLRARTDVPLNLLVYGNLVERRGVRTFVRDAVSAGASSLLVPDVPLEESGPLIEACAHEDLGHVQLCGPATPARRVADLGVAASAFVYLVGHQGVTGARDALAPGTRECVARVAGHAGVPVAVGFGLRDAGHVRAVLAAGASVAVVGSALVRRIPAHIDREGRIAEHALLAEIRTAVRDLAAAAADLEGERCS